MTQIHLSFEDEPPAIERATIHPYPDLKRLWVRVGLSSFEMNPNLDVTIIGPEGETEVEMTYLDNREPHVSFTMHLPRPVPEATYLARFVLSREDEVLDTKEIAFDLVFREPGEETAPGTP